MSNLKPTQGGAQELSLNAHILDIRHKLAP